MSNRQYTDALPTAQFVDAARDPVFMGVDVHLHRFTVAIISADLHVITVRDMCRTELMRTIAEVSPSVIAIDAPYGPNLGLMDDPCYRAALQPGLHEHYRKKVAEYELSRRGFALYNTPSKFTEMDGWKAWMKAGIKLFAELAQTGFIHFHADNCGTPVQGTAEVYPHAAFAVLMGCMLPKKTTENGLNMRKELLIQAGMRGISELRGGKGRLADCYDALIAAYTAYAVRQGNILFVGDRAEGQIALPVKTIKDKYMYCF